MHLRLLGQNSITQLCLIPIDAVYSGLFTTSMSMLHTIYPERHFSYQIVCETSVIYKGLTYSMFLIIF